MHDPVALHGVALKHPELTLEQDLDQAFTDVDAVVLATEWKEYRALDPAVISTLVKSKIIIDGRNVLDRELWRNAGWKFRALGRTD